jgi:hypothetical protein
LAEKDAISFFAASFSFETLVVTVIVVLSQPVVVVA